VAAAIYKNDRS